MFEVVSNLVGGTASLSCVVPFFIVGSPTYECQNNEMWYGDGECGKP